VPVRPGGFILSRKESWCEEPVKIITAKGTRSNEQKQVIINGQQKNAKGRPRHDHRT
jgi:DNA polymerase IIIc chi subunit